MPFCPKCESFLYPTRKALYCKTCKTYYVLRNNKIVRWLEFEGGDGTSVEKGEELIDSQIKMNINFKEKDEEFIDSQIKMNINFKEKGFHYFNFFPYKEFRENQENIIKEIEISAREKKNILLVAPNGTGKTVIALSALLPIVYERDLKIIYMCRTHTQNTRVIKELSKISKLIENSNTGFKVNGISIRGRNEMCLNKTLLSLKLNPRESLSVCTDLRKNRNCIHFLNLRKKKDEVDNPILIAPDILDKPIDAEELIKLCKEKRICPYFLSKYLLEQMKVIICNYQWVFNPSIRDSFMKFIGRELQDCIIVIDECHNIIDVATDVNSDKISPYTLKICLKDLEMYKSPPLMQSFVKSLMEHLRKKKKSLQFEKEITPDSFLELTYKKIGISDLNGFKNFLKDLLDYSLSIHEERLANGEISRDYIGNLAEFWLKWIETYALDNYFFCYNTKNVKDKKSISLEIVALDPREIAIPILKNCYSCLNLSGTANPYIFNNLMGLNTSGKAYKGIIAESPFKKKNIKAVITEGIDTKRESRTPFMFKKMMGKMEEVISSTPANIGIFCASYKILNGLVTNNIEYLVNKCKKKLFIEEPGLSASENALLIEDFKSMSNPPNKGAVLLGVCGGRNSEGEDYPGDFMNAVIIAGFPYHLPTPRVNAKIQYYDKVFDKQGWNFGYLYPAIQRANQASGRPIRKASDKGALIFMDSRFKDKYNWISDWVRKVIEIIPDKKNAIYQNLYPFWNENGG